jgi:outer membrane protein assembly factor BamB
MVWEFEAVGGVPSSPAVWGGLVFIATNEGYLYALDARNGRIVWEQEDDSPYPIISSPAVWVPGSLEWPMFRGNPQRTGMAI